ncbi:hypothetical protein OV203_47600 [Nannocystis sp. ILAH1]|uniref:hypothetical protein n=1 Tax=Nannocystis sp. ILAH1 TaxID=2996789 RepID=UPI00226F7537|nr:hypothetical protein [Nannocystis sp. ILAH1]MCY0994885.1 hypothetical protein [Nannocystis sp. ILAH1]
MRSSVPIFLSTLLVVSLGEPAPARATAPEPAIDARAEPAEPAEPAFAADPAAVDPAALVAEAAVAEPAVAGEEDPAVYAARLRSQISVIRGPLLDRLADKIMDKQSQKMDQISGVLSRIALCGLLLLLLPLVSIRRYPGKFGVLFRYSALAAVTFVIAVNLFSGALMLLRGIQAGLGSVSNPQVQMVEATLALLDEKAEEMAPMGPLIIEPTLAQLSLESEEPLPVIMLENVQKFRDDMQVFSTVASFFKSVSWVLAYIPVVLTLLTGALFFLAIRPTLLEIVRLPGRAARGEAGVGRTVIKKTLQRISREFLATLGVIVVLIALTLLASVLTTYMLQPALETFIAYLSLAFIYVQVEPNASSSAVLASLVGVTLFLVFNLVAVVAASALYLGKSQKIFQRRFHDKVPLAAHRRFWRWGTIGLLWVQLFPIAYIFAAKPLVELLIDKTLDPAAPDWGFVLVSGPAVLLVLFVITFWLARGVGALRFLARYRPQDVHAS